MFISSVVQYIKIADVSMHQVGVDLTSDAPAEDVMDVDDEAQFPSGVDTPGMPTLSREEEHALARESTAGFADWVTSLFRRVLALFENLPEEGGKKGTTGGKMEEAVLKAIKGALDTVCLHLSDPLFDLVLKLVFDYASTNAKSNSVRAFGQLVSCLARVRPEKTVDKFLPFCLGQIQEELRHGASSIRTTSTHEAVPSDTTLHWSKFCYFSCAARADLWLRYVHSARLLRIRRCYDAQVQGSIARTCVSPCREDEERTRIHRHGPIDQSHPPFSCYDLHGEFPLR